MMIHIAQRAPVIKIKKPEILAIQFQQITADIAVAEIRKNRALMKTIQFAPITDGALAGGVYFRLIAIIRPGNALRQEAEYA